MITSAPFPKRLLAGLLGRSGVLRADLALRTRQSVMAVNYHGTPLDLAAKLRGQLMFLRERFQCLDEEDLLRFLAGDLQLRRPGIVICFDDGSHDNAAVAAPLLEELGLVGWFMIPGGFLDQPVAEQPAFFADRIRSRPTAEHPQQPAPRAMTWPALRALAGRGHVVGCHTWSHRTLGATPSLDVLHEEVVVARERLQQQIGRPIRTFAWVRGQLGDYSAPVQRLIRETYQLAFLSMGRAIHSTTSPWGLHRFNLEASFPPAVVRFQLSHFNEGLFAARRNAVDRILRTTAEAHHPPSSR